MSEIDSLKGSPVTFTTGCAIDRDTYYVACSPDLWRTTEDALYTSMCIFDVNAANPWRHHELPDWRVSSVLCSRSTGSAGYVLYSLSDRGEIEVLDEAGARYEKVEDADIDVEEAYGHAAAINKIGDDLYICGDGGQIYKKIAEQWVHFDAGLLKRKSLPANFHELDSAVQLEAISALMSENILFSNIDGAGSDEIYVSGTDGVIAYYDGNSWVKLSPVTAAHLNGICMDADGTVWIVGSRGTLLRGKKESFSVVLRKPLKTDFYAAAIFMGEMYVSAGDGIYKVRGADAVRLDVSDKFNLNQISCIEEKDGVLWAMSERKLVRFDGKNWQCFEHPNNISV